MSFVSLHGVLSVYSLFCRPSQCRQPSWPFAIQKKWLWTKPTNDNINMVNGSPLPVVWSAVIAWSTATALDWQPLNWLTVFFSIWVVCEFLSCVRKLILKYCCSSINHLLNEFYNKNCKNSFATKGCKFKFSKGFLLNIHLKAPVRTWFVIE